MLTPEQKVARGDFPAHKAELAARKKAYYQAHKAELAARRKVYRQVHRAEIIASKKAYYQSHKAEIIAYQKAYQQTHKAGVAAYRQTHKAEITANRKAYRQAYPYKRLDDGARRRALKAGATVEKVFRTVVYERDGGRCHRCGKRVPKKGWHLDHLVPLARGGEHSYSNVAVSHPKCNMIKGIKPSAKLRLF